MVKFRVLKGVQNVYHRPDGTRVLVYPAKANIPTKAFTRTKNRPATGVKLHYTHDLRPVNKAIAFGQKDRNRGE